jgi:hypothetical protein
MSEAADSSAQMDRMLDSMTQKKPENESQFQKLGEVVENDDDNGVVEIESLCMNCHDNVRCLSVSVSFIATTDTDFYRELHDSFFSAFRTSVISSSNPSNARIAISKITP